jgi:hypothetical protein
MMPRHRSFLKARPSRPLTEQVGLLSRKVRVFSLVRPLIKIRMGHSHFRDPEGEPLGTPLDAEANQFDFDNTTVSETILKDLTTVYTSNLALQHYSPTFMRSYIAVLDELTSGNRKYDFDSLPVTEAQMTATTKPLQIRPKQSKALPAPLHHCIPKPIVSQISPPPTVPKVSIPADNLKQEWKRLLLARVEEEEGLATMLISVATKFRALAQSRRLLIQEGSDR